MKNYKILTCFLISLFVFHNLIAQDSQVQLPTIIPPSPTAAALARYGEIPVDYSTGVPKIDIPLYTIRSGKLELPISVSYHASGIKANDVTTDVGLGWVLNAGGAIARTVFGKRDEDNRKLFKSSSEITAAIGNTITDIDKVNLAEELDWLCNNTYDTQSDRYSYNFNGHAGIFRYNFLDSLTPLCVPYSPIKITRKKVNPEDYAPCFEIVDENGNTYIFLFQDTECSYGRQGNPNYSWFLSTIISSDNTDTMQFHYTPGDPIMEDYWSCTLDIGCSSQGDFCNNPPYNFTFDNGYIYHGTKLLDNITCRSTVVQFVYSKDNLDSKRTSRLAKMTVINKIAGNIVREILFDHTNFGSGAGKRLRLDGIHVKGTSVSNVQNYAFLYNNTIEVPDYDVYTDYWGYCNGGTIIGPPYLPKLIPKEYLNLLPYDKAALYGGNRNPDPLLMQMCMLQEIHYPTGGKTVFEFEPNKASSGYYDYSNQNNGVIGGLRIKKMSTYSDVNASPMIKTYQYTEAQGATALSVERTYFHYEKTYRYSLLATTESNGGVLLDADEWEYNHDIYFSSPLFSLTTASGAPAVYDKVIEYTGTTESNIGKTEYTYDWDRSLVYEDIPVFASAFQFDRGNGTPRLGSKTDFKYENGTYKRVQSKRIGYEYFKTNLFNTGINIYHGKTWIPVGDRDPHAPYMNASEYLSDFVFSDTKAYEDVPLMTQTIDSTYSDNNTSVAIVTNCNYDDYTQLAAKNINTSDKGILKTEYKYPYDNLPNEPYQTMFNSHIFAPVIEQIESKGTIPLQDISTSYKDWGNNIIAPDFIKVKIGNNPFETRLRYDNYDNKGNVLSVSKENDMKISYIWGYNQTLPVVKAENVSNNDLATAVNSSVANNLEGLLATIDDMTSDAQKNAWKSFNTSLHSALPANAMVSTYTYKPLVGMTSSTDPNGVTTYYEYDTFGQLRLERDKDGKILKMYQYNYRVK